MAKKTEKREDGEACSGSAEPGNVFRKPASELANQLSRLAESMETSTIHKVECFVCNRRNSARDCTEQKFARYLHEKGWRYIESEICQTIGIACLKCVAKPDEKRLDW